MTTARACWLLCVVFAVAAICSSAITVVPRAERTLWLIMGVEVSASIGFAALGFASRRIKLLERPWLGGTLWAVAILATIVVLISSVG